MHRAMSWQQRWSHRILIILSALIRRHFKIHRLSGRGFIMKRQSVKCEPSSRFYTTFSEGTNAQWTLAPSASPIHVLVVLLRLFNHHHTMQFKSVHSKRKPSLFIGIADILFLRCQIYSVWFLRKSDGNLGVCDCNGVLNHLCVTPFFCYCVE